MELFLSLEVTSRRGPPSAAVVSCRVLSSMPTWRASATLARVGSITKHTVAGQPSHQTCHERTGRYAVRVP